MLRPSRKILEILSRGTLGAIVLAAATFARSTDDFPKRLQIPGIENTFQLGPQLFSGGDPRGAEDFAAIRALGIRTIVSVDGSSPDVASARAAGLRYVHLPIGYDGVPTEQAMRILKAVKSLPGPVYVHCHHGKHRGPAAAAICGVASQGWTTDQAVAWMNQAGTSPSYPGLFASVRQFTPPTEDALARVADDFPETARVPALVEMMVHVDQTWDRLQDVRNAGFRAPKDHPDLDPSHEALQLAEWFREAARLPEARNHGDAFLLAMQAAEEDAFAMHQALASFAKAPATEPTRPLEALGDAISKSCTQCHAKFRDHR